MPPDHRIPRRRSALLGALIGALMLAPLAVANPAAADDEITYGDVVAHFQASEGAGGMIDTSTALDSPTPCGRRSSA